MALQRSHGASEKEPQRGEKPGPGRAALTRRARADVDDVTLGPRDVLVPHLQGDDLHEYRVLGPGLEVQESDLGVDVLALGEVHVHHVPTVRPAAVLAVELRDVLEGTGEDRQQGGAFYDTPNQQIKCAREPISRSWMMTQFTADHFYYYSSTFKAAIGGSFLPVE